MTSLTSFPIRTYSKLALLLSHLIRADYSHWLWPSQSKPSNPQSEKIQLFFNMFDASEMHKSLFRSNREVAKKIPHDHSCAIPPGNCLL
jgi:hypothetical protein